MPRPKDDLPQNVPEHMRLMLDLIVLAFQMDKTRIATCMLNNDLSPNELWLPRRRAKARCTST
jgi:hypothetical protein